MKKILLICLYMGLFVPMYAQKTARAEAAYQANRFEEARGLYESLYKESPKHPLYIYRLARCEQELGLTTQAIEHFEKAGEKYPVRNYFLGELYMGAYRFTEAKECLSKYLSSIGEDHERYAATAQMLRMVERAERYLARIEDVVIYDSVSFSADDLGAYLPLSQDHGTIQMENGQYTFINQRGDRRFFTVEDSTARTLICCQQRLLDEWGMVDTLPASVNKFDKQAYPFLMADGLTLYYAAKSESGLGGWDIYVTKYNPATGTYLTPEMLGMPFNSLDDDFLFYVDEQTGKGYFFSNRATTPQRLVRYTFVPTDEKRFLRDSTEAYVAQYAMLHTLRQPQVEQAAEEETVITPAIDPLVPAAEPAAWRFIVTDSLIYTSLDDFQVAEAREWAEQYKEKTALLDEESAELMELRTLYQKAEGEEKKTLLPDILSLEKEIIALRNELKSLPAKIRMAEMNR